MTKIKTVYDLLKPEVKLKLKASARDYSGAKRLKYTLMSKYLWSQLTVNEVNDLLSYADVHSWKLAPYSFMYGDNIIEK